MSFSVRQLTIKDAEIIRQWRNAQMDVLRQDKIIGRHEQRKYFREFVLPEYLKEKPSQYLVGIQKVGLVAYGGVTRINWTNGTGEISFLMSPEDESSDELPITLSEFLDWAIRHAFETMELYKLFSETYSFRSTHLKILEKSGFEKEGELKDHVLVSGRRYNSVLHGLIRNNG